MKKKIIIAVILGVIIFGVSAYLLLRWQASKETNNEIKNKVNNINEYSKIIIGFQQLDIH